MVVSPWILDHLKSEGYETDEGETDNGETNDDEKLESSDEENNRFHLSESLVEFWETRDVHLMIRVLLSFY